MFSFRKVYLEYLCSDKKKKKLKSLGKAQEVDYSVTGRAI